MMNVKLFQMLSGDLLIGEELTSDDVYTNIKNPLRVVILPNQNQNNKNPSIALAPWCEFSDDTTFTFRSDHVICAMKPVHQFISQYNQTFGKIHILPPSLILPGA